MEQSQLLNLLKSLLASLKESGNTNRIVRAKGGGIYVENSGIISIHGGLVSENLAVARTNYYPQGDDMHITGYSTVTMPGGIISKNSTNGYGYDCKGGGIFAENGSSFIKRPAWCIM